MAETAATRMQKSRKRRKAGIRVLRVEVGIDTVEALIETDYLEAEDSHSLEAVSAALALFIEDAAQAVSCDSITLESW